jgi:hypothetical protein
VKDPQGVGGAGHQGMCKARYASKQRRATVNRRATCFEQGRVLLWNGLPNQPKILVEAVGGGGIRDSNEALRSDRKKGQGDLIPGPTSSMVGTSARPAPLGFAKLGEMEQ